MRIHSSFLFVVLFFSSLGNGRLLAQMHVGYSDTLTVMVYNLLNFGTNTTGCTSTNNNVAEKRTGYCGGKRAG